MKTAAAQTSKGHSPEAGSLNRRAHLRPGPRPPASDARPSPRAFYPTRPPLPDFQTHTATSAEILYFKKML